MRTDLTPRKILAARAIAVTADVVQLGLAPLVGPGWVLNEVLDVAVAVALVSLVGWHWAFLPSFLAESVPVMDVVPSWTAAVLFATRNGTRTPAPQPPVGEKLAGSGSTKSQG